MSENIIEKKIQQMLFKALNCSESEKNELESELLELLNDRNEYIRANAILSFGHLARRFGHLDNKLKIIDIIKKIIENDSNFTKGSADSALDDIEMFA